MKFETLLKLLAASRNDQLRIEPDVQPYFVSDNNKKPASDLITTAANVSAMIFPLIPVGEKMRLPSVPQVAFTLLNEIGEFNIVVGKSAAGLNVTVNKISSHLESSVQSNAEREAVLPLVPAVSAPIAVAASTAASESNDIHTTESKSASAAEIVKPKSFFDSLQSAFLTGSKNKEQIQITESVEEKSQPIAPAAKPAVVEVKNYHHIESASVPIYAPRAAAVESPPEKTFKAAATHGAAHSAHSAPQMNQLFYQMAELKSSDLHLSVSMPPMVRKDGKMQLLDDSLGALSAEAMRDLLRSIMPEKNVAEFERRHDTDFAYEIPGLARFRANIFLDRKGMGGVFRIIPTKILTAEQLGLSKPILDLCDLSKGLVVVTGPTGSGKSTTLCAMVDHINKHREDHIITIEDPIEFTHENQKCLVNQREVHNHTDSFKDALRAALREDPDILLVGEMRDLETIAIAIETAETGHLVFGTLHTTTAPSTVDRIIDQFPADRQQQIRVMLSESLKGVIAQTLLPKKGGGRVAALEVLIVTPAISNLIREGKTFQIQSAMQTGKNHGMVVLNDALFELVKKGLVEPRDAYIKAVDKTGFDALLKRNNISL